MTMRRCRNVTAVAVLAAALPAFGPAVAAVADDPPILEYSSSGSGPAAAGLFADPYDPGRRFQGFLPAMFVRIMALRDIAAGEELWVDYGPRYRYDFMEDPEVIKFFAGLASTGPRRHP